MIHVYAKRFDVTRNLENILVFGVQALSSLDTGDET